MSEKIFKNRITQETPNTIKQLKSLWIDMNSDTDGFIEWFVAANKKDDTMEDIMRGATYAGLLSNMVHCTLSDTVFNKKIWGNEKASDEDIKSLAKTMADFMDSL